MLWGRRHVGFLVIFLLFEITSPNLKPNGMSLVCIQACTVRNEDWKFKSWLGALKLRSQGYQHVRIYCLYMKCDHCKFNKFHELKREHFHTRETKAWISVSSCGFFTRQLGTSAFPVATKLHHTQISGWQIARSLRLKNHFVVSTSKESFALRSLRLLL